MKKLMWILNIGLVLVVFWAPLAPAATATSGPSAVAEPVGEQCFVRLAQADSLPRTRLPPLEVDIPDYPYPLRLEGWPEMTGSESSLLLASDDIPQVQVYFDPVKMAASMSNAERSIDDVAWSRGFLELGFRCPSMSTNRSLFLQYSQGEKKWTAFVP